MPGARILKFIAVRLLVSVPVVLGILFLTFMLTRIGHQDPVALLAGPMADEKMLAMIRAKSPSRMALSPHCPIPPQEKMYSISAAAASSEVSSEPRKVSIGTNALRSAIRRMVACENPLARAKRT